MANHKSEKRISAVEALHSSFALDERKNGQDFAAPIASFLQLCRALERRLQETKLYGYLGRIEDLVDYWDLQLIKSGTFELDDVIVNPQISKIADMLMTKVDETDLGSLIDSMLGVSLTSDVSQLALDPPTLETTQEEHKSESERLTARRNQKRSSKSDEVPDLYLVVDSPSEDDPAASLGGQQWLWRLSKHNMEPADKDNTSAIEDGHLKDDDADELFRIAIQSAAEADKGTGFPELAMALRLKRIQQDKGDRGD